MMKVTGPEGERGDIGVLNPASTTAPVTMQSGHSLEDAIVNLSRKKHLN